MVDNLFSKGGDGSALRSSCVSRLCLVVCIAISVHVLYNVGMQRSTFYGISLSRTKDNVDADVSFPSNMNEPLPLFFIYRRTKKTGSSSMLSALLNELVPLGYQPLYYHTMDMATIARMVASSFRPQRVFIAQHNSVTREDTWNRPTVIADTVRDGYLQMTSYCRHVRSVQTCDEQMVKCLKSKNALEQKNYRWAGRDQEDKETYIDAPLSSEHPALSTTMLRNFYPNVTLRIHEYNVKNSSCAEIPAIRAVYDELYSSIDEQVEMLWKRLLVLTGYPVRGDSEEGRDITVMDMLDAAERMEQTKYDFGISENRKFSSAKSDNHGQLTQTVLVWARDDSGRPTLRHKRVR